MPYDSLIHHRRSIRLKGFDYSQPGAYFITLATWQRHRLFGTIENGQMALSEIGKIAAACWQRLPAYFAIRLDAWVLMPDHFHGIVVITPDDGEASTNKQVYSVALSHPQKPIGTVPGSLGAVVQNFKAISTRKINQALGRSGAPVWQRNYCEHIIRSEAEWDRIRLYIETNPQSEP